MQTKIAVSIGEPAGIGPDQIIMLCQKPQHCNLIAFCDPNLLYQRAKDLKLNIEVINIRLSDLKNNSLPLLPSKAVYVVSELSLTSSHSAQISSHSAQISSHSAQISSHSAQISSHSAQISSHSAPILSLSAPTSTLLTPSSRGLTAGSRKSNLQKIPAPTVNAIMSKPQNYVKKNNDSIEYIAGKVNQATASNTLDYLTQATLACLDNYCDALVTCPIQKSLINSILPSFMGHTEYLEDLCNQYYNKPNHYKSVMMLMNEQLKTALITTHIPLSQVAASITKEKIIHIAEIIHNDLINKFNIFKPHILVTGLNPHAGEDGKLGSEEIEIISPAIDYLKSKNLNISGPYAADSIYNKQDLAPSEVILAMYHDQGLTGFKARAFNTAANITLGLPIIRTSVDHGTALNLAGTGNINLSSLEYAINIANKLAANKISTTV